MVSEALTAEAKSPPFLRSMLRSDAVPVDWVISDGPVDYPVALQGMKTRASAIAAGEAPEAVWLLEHPPLYTAGTSADPTSLLDAGRFPVYAAGRGGQYTYHGPGQRIAYVMLDLRQRGRDVRCFVHHLESWIIDCLAAFAVRGERREGRIGVWVRRPDKGVSREDKIAALGVRVSRWISFHGVSINISPDLGHYSGIVPCGITDQGVTSLEDLGRIVSTAEVDMALGASFVERFGAIRFTPEESLVSPRAPYEVVG